jgi:hypothetical protein
MSEIEFIDHNYIEITTNSERSTVGLAYIQNTSNPVFLSNDFTDEYLLTFGKKLLLRRCDYDPMDSPFWRDSRIDHFVTETWGYIDRFAFRIIPNSQFDYKLDKQTLEWCMLGELIYIAKK